MNRLKFRVWDIERKEYRKYFDFCHSPDGIWVTNDGHNMDDAIELFIIEQSTGLIDSKGVEVFEGDIVKWSDPRKSGSMVNTVEWCEDYAGFIPFHDAEEFEKVGNKHEEGK